MEVVGRLRMMELAVMTVSVPDDGDAISSSSSSGRGSNGAFFARRRRQGPSYFSGSGGPDPASSEAIAALPRRVVLPGQEKAARSEDCCAVCLDDLEHGGAMIRGMPCSHSFHEGCIFRWLAVSRVCPCCRFPLPSATDDEQCRGLLDDKPAAAGAGAGRRTN